MSFRARARAWAVRSWAQGADRLRRAAIPVLVASVAAVLAFVVARFGFGHPAPFFAPCAAWICLGFTKNRQPVRVAELGAGAVLGVLTAELMMRVTGSGVWQLGVVLIVAALGARFTARGDLFTVQAGVNAMVVMALGPTSAATPVSRVVDALIGGIVALLFAAAWPRDVTTRARRYVRSAQTELARTMDRVAKGLRRGDLDQLREAHNALGRTRESARAAKDVVASAVGIATINPLMRRYRPRLDELRRQLSLVMRMANSVETLTRQAWGVVLESGADPAAAALVAQARQVLGRVRSTVAEWAPPTPARTAATELAASCSPARAVGDGWHGTVLISVVRMLTIDLLQMTGLSRAQARAELPGVDPEDEDPSSLAVDGPSALWGLR